MGLRIEREEFVNKTFRLNAKLMQEVAAVSAKKNISMNRLVDIALRYALEHLEEGESNG
jgi:predicted HicB family RNase H-like nuclease